MLDIVLFRTDQGGNPDLVRESQRRRYKDVSLVDKVIEIDSEWRQTRGATDNARKERGMTQKKIGEFMKKKEKPPDDLLAAKKAHDAKIVELEEKEKELATAREQTISKIGEPSPRASGASRAGRTPVARRQPRAG
jgi:seryl-tRNA synthetase